jgi:hypothetical protein
MKEVSERLWGFGYWNLRIRPGIPNANRGDRVLTGVWS